MEPSILKRRVRGSPARASIRALLSILAFIAAIFAVVYLAFWSQDALAPGEQRNPGVTNSPGAPHRQ
jgi:hypothetical protein